MLATEMRERERKDHADWMKHEAHRTRVSVFRFSRLIVVIHQRAQNIFLEILIRLLLHRESERETVGNGLLKNNFL